MIAKAGLTERAYYVHTYTYSHGPAHPLCRLSLWRPKGSLPIFFFFQTLFDVGDGAEFSGVVAKDGDAAAEVGKARAVVDELAVGIAGGEGVAAQRAWVGLDVFDELVGAEDVDRVH